MHHGSYVTTPRVADMMSLLGSGGTMRAVALGRDELKAIQKLYKFEEEQLPQKPEEPKPPVPLARDASWADRQAHALATDRYKALKASFDKWEPEKIQNFMQAGADLNALRHAEADGLRLLAWIARHVPPGGDPLKILVQLAMDAGWDVDPEDVDWAEGQGELEDANVEQEEV